MTSTINKLALLACGIGQFKALAAGAEGPLVRLLIVTTGYLLVKLRGLVSGCRCETLMICGYLARLTAFRTLRTR